MADPVWYRSLYWRFGLGFIGLVATLLLIQGFVFLWMTGRMSELFPSRTPAQLAAAIAVDLSSTLTQHPETDLTNYLESRYSRASRPFVVVMRDQRTFTSSRVPPPPNAMRAARGRLFGDTFPDHGGPPPPDGWGRGRGPGPGGPGFGPPPAPGTPGSAPDAGDGRGRRGGRRGDGRGPDGGWRGDGRGPDGFGRGGRDGRDGGDGGPPNTFEFAPITIDGLESGIVAVSIDPPPLMFALRDLGPTLATVALALLVTGTVVASLVVFRPARRRLQELQRAAQAIGTGTTGVRAADTGRDEVAALAHAFNEMAARLEERTGALHNADRTRRQLLADVSHELSTPLAAIRGYVETLGMPDLALDDVTRRRYLGIVFEETERLEHIIGDLLDLAKLEGGGANIRHDEVSLAQLFERIRRRHEQVLRDRDISLRTELSADTPIVMGDANRLEQALQNLVANAVRHTPSGGRIVVSSRAQEESDGRVVVLAVDDSGPGIPPEHLTRVFDRFYKADSSRAGTTVPSGSGLGLSIVQAIVHRHGGTVTASNAPTGGARFEIALPTPLIPPQS